MEHVHFWICEIGLSVLNRYYHVIDIFFSFLHIDGLVQERRNSIADALDLRLSRTYPSIWYLIIFHALADHRQTSGCGLPWLLTWWPPPLLRQQELTWWPPPLLRQQELTWWPPPLPRQQELTWWPPPLLRQQDGPCKWETSTGQNVLIKTRSLALSQSIDRCFWLVSIVICHWEVLFLILL